ncbi:hypothetical protein CERSUDRAFT_93607 [Gelatoporia subvermispora B]|uniref:Ubiquitin 3 binding protein But2 C-terminal domain-containing protein n=1 Tax=Ceriporiopsis subvermispora (strain B) TaxID=914234 RepID=M2RHX3_CERS8|nr:hypothetical protein CERSUDRAFT_93607 [Gelatoporia subvermispora B]
MDASKHEYIPLSPSDKSHELLSEENSSIEQDIHQSTGSTSWNGWTWFLAACILSAALSAINLGALSAVQTIRSLPTPIKTPSVYMGLDTLRGKNNTLCRSRVTYPESVATFEKANIRGRTRLHAPGDKMILEFGDTTSAYINFRIPDYGLENCTLSLKCNDTSTYLDQTQFTASVEIWLLQNEGKLRDKVLLDTLTFANGAEPTTAPFFCAAQSHVFFHLRCPGEGCQVQIPLQNVTAMTAGVDSRLQTGLSLTQYEALTCIP